MLLRLKTFKKFKKDIDLANFLEISATTLSTWKHRGTIDWWIVFDKCDDINLNWLVHGTGSMLLPEIKYDDAQAMVRESVPEYEFSERGEPKIKELYERLLAEKERILEEKERYIGRLESEINDKKEMDSVEKGQTSA